MNKLFNSSHWSEYWLSGNKTTFNSAFKDGYDSIIEDYWDSVFKTISSKNVVLDLCCGNGALMSLLANYSIKNSISPFIMGVDYAEVKVQLPEPFNSKNAKVLSNTSVEDLPISSRTIDLVISQYGIEYADINRAINEASRVLNEESSIALIAHTLESDIVIEAKTNLSQLELCSDKTNLIKNVKRMIFLLQNHSRSELSSSNRKKTDKLRLLINKELKLLQGVISESSQNTFIKYFINSLMSVFAKKNKKSLNMEEKLEIMLELEKEISYYKVRLNDLLNSALSIEQQSKLKKLLEREGFEIKEFSSMYYKSSNMGIKIHAKRG